MSQRGATLARRIVVTRDIAYCPTMHRDDEVTVWVIPLTEPPTAIEVMFSDLTGEERSRAERLRVDSARRQFVVTRASLRRVLGAQLEVLPIEVPISQVGAGKPAVSGADFHFNVTHTEGLGLIALARRPVGVDVERLRTPANPEGLVSRFFSPRECDDFLALPAELRRAGFIRGWTCKEAIIKASGLSIAYLDGFDVELHPARPAALLAARHPVVAASAWSLAAWEPEGGFAAAVAVEGAGELRIDEV
jgi:4'-phosphopantetheinyl transferase